MKHEQMHDWIDLGEESRRPPLFPLSLSQTSTAGLIGSSFIGGIPQRHQPEDLLSILFAINQSINQSIIL
jgi:hypothetical protein